MIPRPPISTRTDTLFPDTTPFRSTPLLRFVEPGNLLGDDRPAFGMPPGFPRGHIPLFPVAAAVRNYLVRSAIIERAGVGNDMLDLRFVGKQRQLADMPPTERAAPVQRVLGIELFPQFEQCPVGAIVAQIGRAHV